MSFNLEKEQSPPQWTLAAGLKLIRAIQPEAKKLGYHIALGGGVLNIGLSYKDLDLYLLPMCCSDKQPDKSELIALLTKMWGHGVAIGKGEYSDEPPYTAKIRYNYSGTRIEVFILGATMASEGDVITRDQTEERERGTELSSNWSNEPDGEILAAVDDARGTWGGIQRNPEPVWRSRSFEPEVLRPGTVIPVSNPRNTRQYITALDNPFTVNWTDATHIERDRPTGAGNPGAAISSGNNQRRR